MSLPDPLERLFAWIEANGYYIDTPNGRLGFLYSAQTIADEHTDDGRPGGTDIEFAAEGNVNLRYWFRSEDPDLMNRLCVFAKTGGDGSMAAFWLADDGTQKIVHLGSGSGSTTVCVLADDPVDFLRLLAIGYDEICWGDELSEPPNASGEFIVQPNRAFAAWVAETFKVTIPERGTDIVRHLASMGDDHSPDPFWTWARAHTG
ncbi:SMI1/KNR4 family protein [Caulobacter sp. 17J65-9]|nr:SMI1/KNR4 family protein [Caulobacter sp. 17J65-9]